MLRKDIVHKHRYVICASILYLIAAYFSEGHNHPDEYYQILEFASYKLGFSNSSHLTWEYAAQIRSGFLPLIAVYIYKCLVLLNYPNPFFTAFLTRLFAAILSLISLLLFIKAFISNIENALHKKWFILLTFFSYLIVYNNIRFSGENLSGEFFLIGVALTYLNIDTKPLTKGLIVGICFGLSFICRFQTGFLTLGILVWLLIINRSKLNYILLITLGFFLVIILNSLMIDYWLYGKFTFSAWNYFYSNIILNKVNTFDGAPWYFYLFIVAFLPYGPFYVIATIVFVIFRPKHILTWAVLPFIFIHLLIAHKELRFLIPILNLMPFFIICACQILYERYSLNIFKYKKTINGFWYFNCVIVLAVALLPSGVQVVLCKKIYNLYNEPSDFYYITEGGNLLDFYKRQNVLLKPINNVDEIKCIAGRKCLVALTCQQDMALKAKINGKLVLNYCPPWIMKLDFNQWLERTAIYRIYQLNR